MSGPGLNADTATFAVKIIGVNGRNIFAVDIKECRLGHYIYYTNYLKVRPVPMHTNLPVPGFKSINISQSS